MGKGYLAALALIVSLLVASAFGAQSAFADVCDLSTITTLAADKRGCCSHHNGVCGCNKATGMQRCCDGTDSPTCRCSE
jgi:hypothetical protein